MAVSRNGPLQREQRNRKRSGKGKSRLMELALEFARVKNELAEVKVERDLLKKKCVAYFAKESQ